MWTSYADPELVMFGIDVIPSSTAGMPAPDPNPAADVDAIGREDLGEEAGPAGPRYSEP